MNGNRAESGALKYLFFVSRLLLGAVFIAAGAGKILHPGEFAGIISNYQILPEQLVNSAAVVLPGLEMIIGVLLVCGFWLPGAVALADLLLLVFLAALASAAARGIDIDCGCFSVKPTASPNFSWYLLRDMFFLLLGAVVTVHTQKTGSSRKDSSF
ncbi:MAG: MauE/DoxX family redox-associated membrane protein [Syntrophobacteraceae bacterium]|nr:MauE/DoxX family redox-associated membrane protein [Syntrophobacteraceae bacterium]